MKVLGVIAEYNPFHRGHAYLIEEAKSLVGAERVVAVMSGNFTQRGEISPWDKWTRAAMAVDSGVDLVLELPFVFACNSASYFARGGVELLSRLVAVTHLAFGSEAGQMDHLKEAAEFLSREEDSFKENLKSNLSQGFSYPKARGHTALQLGNKQISEVLKTPNNILGVEYLRELSRQKSPMIPITVKRAGSGYHDKELLNAVDGNNSFSSASAIRQALCSGADIYDLEGHVPLGTFKRLPVEAEAKLDGRAQESLYSLVTAEILKQDASRLNEIFSGGEGLGSKLKKEIRETNSIESLVRAVKSKRYTETRIRRLLIHTLMGLTVEKMVSFLDGDSMYGKVLAGNEAGTALLREIKKKKDPILPVYSNWSKRGDLGRLKEEMLSFDILATDLYNLLMNRDLSINCEQRQGPVF